MNFKFNSVQFLCIDGVFSQDASTLELDPGDFPDVIWIGSTKFNYLSIDYEGETPCDGNVAGVWYMAANGCRALIIND